MNIEVQDHIADILYDKSKINIPGLGGFQATYQKAKADKVSGKMLPPSKEFRFSKEIPGNDGFLVKYIKDRHTISYADAQQAVSDYIDSLKSSLDNKEIVVLPKIGRLYKDYKDDLKFLPDRENFNKSTFGLPSVDLLPPIKESILDTPISEGSVPAPLDKPRLDWIGFLWRNKRLFGIAASVLLTLLTINFFLKTPISTEKPIAINTSPSMNMEVVNEQEKEEIPVDEFQFKTVPETQMDNTKSITPYEAMEENLPKPKEFVAVISLGAFAIRINADRLASTLRKNGYENPKVTPLKGGKSRVTLEVSYDTKEELEKGKKELRRKINPDDMAVIATRRNVPIEE